jgi:hypothetical protein
LEHRSLGAAKVYKNRLKNIVKIVKCLQEAEEGWVWLREIGRRCDMAHTTVSRIVSKELASFVETQTMEPFNAQMVRLKADVDMDGVLRFLAAKKRIDEMNEKLGIK